MWRRNEPSASTSSFMESGSRARAAAGIIQITFRLCLPMEESAAPAPAKAPSALGALSLMRDMAISIVLAVILIVFIYQPVKVEGTSMMPGLTDQERIFINKYEYKLGVGSIERGDLVVFHFPLDP